MSNNDYLPATTPEFSIALVNYQTLEMTRICLNLLHQYVTQNNIALWVVDNNSKDESTQYLRSLDWINLIERKTSGREQGHIAHGKALDRVLAEVKTDYLFLLHTDTFVYDTQVFAMMHKQAVKKPDIAAIGCVEQLYRGAPRSLWRFGSRLLKHHYRTFKRSVGLPSKEPKPYREVYLKSFCTLWNCALIKQHNLRFLLDERVPGYTLQDRVIQLGYAIRFMPARKLFRYLDHIQAGTVAATGEYGAAHRRSKMYAAALKRFKPQAG